MLDIFKIDDDRALAVAISTRQLQASQSTQQDFRNPFIEAANLQVDIGRNHKVGLDLHSVMEILHEAMMEACQRSNPYYAQELLKIGAVITEEAFELAERAGNWFVVQSYHSQQAQAEQDM